MCGCLSNFFCLPCSGVVPGLGKLQPVLCLLSTPRPANASLPNAEAPKFTWPTWSWNQGNPH